MKSMKFGDVFGPGSTPEDEASRAERVRRGFWKKFRATARHIPFAEDAVASYFAAFDRQTPLKVRAALLAALAYFVLPVDLTPDFLPLIGFSDDAAVLMGALRLLSGSRGPRDVVRGGAAAGDVGAPAAPERPAITPFVSRPEPTDEEVAEVSARLVAAGWPLGKVEETPDEAETPETQHLRNYSSYLVPNGLADYFADILIVIRGIVANILMLAPALFALASARAATVGWRCGNSPCSAQAAAKPTLRGVFVEVDQESWWTQAFGPFAVAPLLAGLLLLAVVGWLIWKSNTRHGGLTLRSREEWSVRLGWAMVGILVVAFIEWQPVILDAMFRASHVSVSTTGAGAQATMNIGPANIGLSVGLGGAPQAAASVDGVSDILGKLFAGLGQAGYVLGPAVIAFVLLAQKLLNIVRATLGDASWTGYAKRLTSKLLLLMLGLSVPLLLWVVFLNLTYAAISPPSLSGSVGHWGAASTSILQVYFVIAVVTLMIGLAFGPNANSLHGLYRDRLSRAFLMEREKIRARSLQAADFDNWTFTSLKPAQPGGAFETSAAFAPYLVVNTAINLQGSNQLGWRGRNADVFTLGALTSGSDATGYVTTQTLEKVDPHLTLATGLAISGAAFSANAGRETRPVLTFSLSALNIRLGYWIDNPARIPAEAVTAPTASRLGILYFYRELFSRIREKTKRIHLTDGGHIENLGLYELTKRRCRVIIAVDAEADQGMVFPSLVNAQLMMRIDHGVRIELPWPEISASCRQADAMIGTPKEDEIRSRAGPHVAVGRIVYRQESAGEGEDVHGVLIYIKSSMSGDENDVIRDYKRRNGDFPHETTLDQFFSEEQFEVYRALGFHMTRRFFTGKDDAAFWTPEDPEQRAEFLQDVRSALTSLGVPRPNVGAIIARAKRNAENADKARQSAA